MIALLLGLACAAWPPPDRAGRRLVGLAASGRLARRPTAVRTVPVLSAGGCAGLGVASGLAVAAWSVPVGVAAACAVGLAAAIAADTVRRQRDRARRSSLAEALRLFSSELDAGASVAVARAASPHPEIATGDLSARPQLARLAAVLAVSETSGAPVADLVGRLEADLLAEADRDRAVATALAGPRSSALLLAVLPAVGIALGAAMGARPMAFLFGAPTGQVVLAAGVVLDCLGVLWTRALVRAAERGVGSAWAVSR